MSHDLEVAKRERAIPVGGQRTYPCPAAGGFVNQRPELTLRHRGKFQMAPRATTVGSLRLRIALCGHPSAHLFLTLL